MDFYIERGIGRCDSINWLAPYAPWPIHRCKKDANFWKMNWISSCWLFLEIALSIGSVKFCMGLGMRTLSIDIKVGSESSMINTYYIIKISNHQFLRIPDFTHTKSTDVRDENAILCLLFCTHSYFLKVLGIMLKKDDFSIINPKYSIIFPLHWKSTSNLQ